MIKEEMQEVPWRAFVKTGRKKDEGSTMMSLWEVRREDLSISLDMREVQWRAFVNLDKNNDEGRKMKEIQWKTFVK